MNKSKTNIKNKEKMVTVENFIKVYYIKYVLYYFIIFKLIITWIALSYFSYYYMNSMIVFILLSVFSVFNFVVYIKKIFFWKNVYKKIRSYTFFDNLTENQVNVITDIHYNKIAKMRYFTFFSIESCLLFFLTRKKWHYLTDYINVCKNKNKISDNKTTDDLKCYISELTF